MSNPPISHAWDPITDLPADWHTLARPDLDSMLKLWDTERASLHDTAKVERLQERLATLWAIETGIIERLYGIDRGMTETLVDLGLGAIQQFSTTGRLSPEAASLIEDQRASLDFIFAYIKEERPITNSYIKELHQLLLRNQRTTEAIDQFGRKFKAELIRGEGKRLPNNPVTSDGSVHEYCPPEFVQEEMESLIHHHNEHERIGVRPEVEAAWLHHRFTQVHPFQDGNGRVARALATMIFLKRGFLPLVIRDAEHNDSYIQALEFADNGDLAPLVSLFTNIELQDLDNAITFVRSMRGEGIRKVAVAAAEATKRRIQEDEERIQSITDGLVDIAERRLREVAIDLRQAFEDVGVTLEASVIANDAINQEWWNQQIVNSARKYQYYVDLGRFRRWVQIRLRVVSVNVPRWHIVVSFHHKELRAGLMAAAMFMTTSEAGFEDARPGILGSDNEFSYSSTSELAEMDFRDWLDKALTKLLEEWQSRV